LAAFLGRRLLFALAVLLGVTFGSFVLIATKFTTICPGPTTPNTSFPPLASNAGQAAGLYWHWLRGVPSGRSLGESCSGLPTVGLWPSLGHTAALLAAAGLLVVVFSLLIGTLAAARAGSVVDLCLRVFSYAAWAVPSFVLALMLQSSLGWAGRRFGFHTFEQTGWPGFCPTTIFNFNAPGCPPAGHGIHYAVGVLRHVTVPAIALALAFIGLHSRYLRSALLVALHAPYTTTARAKGLSERRVVIRHALRSSLATFASVFLLDFGAIFGAAMAVDWVFRLGGLGSLLINEINGVGGGDGPRYLDAYAVETLLALAALLVLAASFAAELVVTWLDPRARVH
jgi:glutathione transport system permease protein